MNAGKNAFALLKEIKSVTPSQVTAHLQAAAQVRTMIASRTAMPSDPTLIGAEDDDEYIGGLKLKLPGTNTHIGIEDCVAFVKKGMNLHFHGKKGGGKSRLQREIVKALNRPTIDENLAIFRENTERVKKDGDKAVFDSYMRLPYQPYVYSCHEESVADDILVSPDLEYDEHGNRKTVLRPGAMLSAWSKELGGGICVLEELDAVMPGRMIACHALLDGQVKVFKSYVMGERTYTKYDKFACIATSNTRGAGENARTYAGTQIQNAALMSRFALSFEVDFLDYDTEHKYLVSKGVDKMTAAKMLEVAWKIRTSPSIEDGISLRDLRNWAQAAEVWMQVHPIANGSMWDNVYKPMAVCSFVTRQADQATRDALGQFLGIC